MLSGTGGTGGALGSAGLPLPGDGERNVRSVMEPELDWRRRGPGGGLELLPFDETELRRIMRFVTVSPTETGVATCVRRAAAAAALERLGLDSRSLTKALVAASDADALGGARWAWMAALVSSSWAEGGMRGTGQDIPGLRLPASVC